MAIIVNDSFEISEYGFGLPTDSTKLATYGYHSGGVLDSGLILDHVTRAQAQLIEQFENSENIRKLLFILVDRVQKQEFDLSDLLALTTLDNATTETLNRYGNTIGLPRSEFSISDDETYRQLIKIKIGINRSTATASAIINTLKLLTDSDDITYLEIYPARVWIQVVADEITAQSKTEIKKVVGGGIGLDIVFLDSIAPPFGFASESGIPVEGSGFNEYDYTESGAEIGGSFTELV